MSEERDSENIERMSAQTISQRLVAVRNWQYIIEEYGNVSGKEELISEVRETMENLQGQLRIQIQFWGGVEVIDKWLETNDPGHNTPSQIKEMDWSWLEQEVEEVPSR